MIDKNIARKIVQALAIRPSDIIIEIGPGQGILTEQILTYADVARLVVIEIDKKLVRQLEEKFVSYHQKNRLEIIASDFLKINLKDFCRQRNFGRIKFLGNLPYSAATAIIQKVISRVPPELWERAVFTIQREVAQKIFTTEELNYLKIFVQHYAEGKILFDISPQSFRPRPEVVSSVILLKGRQNISPEVTDIELAAKIFRYRRKTILNSLTFSGFDRAMAKEILEKAAIDPGARAESLSLEQFLRLTTAYKKGII